MTDKFKKSVIPLVILVLTFFLMKYLGRELDPVTSYLGGPVNITKNNPNITVNQYEVDNEIA